MGYFVNGTFGMNQTQVFTWFSSAGPLVAEYHTYAIRTSRSGRERASYERKRSKRSRPNLRLQFRILERYEKARITFTRFERLTRRSANNMEVECYTQTLPNYTTSDFSWASSLKLDDANKHFKAQANGQLCAGCASNACLMMHYGSNSNHSNPTKINIHVWLF